MDKQKAAPVKIEYLDGMLSYAVKNADGTLRAGGNTPSSKLEINISDNPKEEKWLKISIEQQRTPMIDTPEILKEFLLNLAPKVVQGYLGSTPYPNESGEHYISFGQDGIKYQNIDMPLQDVLSTDKFKEALAAYAQDKQRLIVRDWPSIRQDKFGKWIIRARLVGDDGTKELRND